MDNKKPTKKKTPEQIAEILGVAVSSVYAWRANGTGPKNPVLRHLFEKLNK